MNIALEDEQVQTEIKRVKKSLGDRVNELDDDNMIGYARMVVIERQMHQELKEFYARTGSYIIEAANGQRQPDPLLTTFRLISKERTAIGERLGLSPKSRGENLKEGRSEEEDELEKMLPTKR